ncbi:MAG: DUF4363 family protein [Clostridiales bacterium]|nr:DUF4363 family protein [Clostridiales bacterium]
MKRLWIALGVLALLLAGSLWNTARVTRVSDSLTAALNQAEAAVAEDDWDTAEELTQQALEQWTAAEPWLAFVLCHENTDEVTTGFQEVLGFLQYRSAPEYDSANGALVAQVEHLAEIEVLNWQNVL